MKGISKDILLNQKVWEDLKRDFGLDNEGELTQFFSKLT